MVTKELILRMAEKQKNEILSPSPNLEVSREGAAKHSLSYSSVRQDNYRNQTLRKKHFCLPGHEKSLRKCFLSEF